MLRVLTPEEVALDKKRDRHLAKCLKTLNSAETFEELEDRLNKIQPMRGNIVETTTKRRLPKGYLDRFESIIRPLVYKGWAIEEIRQVLQKITARRITHQLVMTFIHNHVLTSHETDIALSCTAQTNLRKHAGEPKETLGVDVQLKDSIEPPVQEKLPEPSVWDYTEEIPEGEKISLSMDKKGFVSIDLSKRIYSELKPTIVSRVIEEFEEKLIQDSDGVELLGILKLEKPFTRSVKLTDASIFLLYVMTRQTIVDAGWATSRDMDRYFEQVKRIPLDAMKWLILENMKDAGGVQLGTIARTSI